MSRNFIQRVEARKSATNGAGNREQPSAAESAKVAGVREQIVKPATRIFDDTDTCRVLGIKRRVLVTARTKNGRGTNWECVGLHAGMTEAWIKSQRADARTEALTPIGADKTVTVEVSAKVPNPQRVVCRRVADGVAVVVSVPPMDDRMLARGYEFRIGDQFDAMDIGTSLVFNRDMNQEAY